MPSPGREHDDQDYDQREDEDGENYKENAPPPSSDSRPSHHLFDLRFADNGQVGLGCVSVE